MSALISDNEGRDVTIAHLSLIGVLYHVFVCSDDQSKAWAESNQRHNMDVTMGILDSLLGVLGQDAATALASIPTTTAEYITPESAAQPLQQVKRT